MPTEYTLLARERRRGIRQLAAQHRKALDAACERDRKHHNDVLLHSKCEESQNGTAVEQQRREKNEASYSRIMAGVYARLKIPVNELHAQARPSDSEELPTYESRVDPEPVSEDEVSEEASEPVCGEDNSDEIFEPVDYHVMIRLLDNPRDQSDCPNDEDLTAHEWLEESYNDLDPVVTEGSQDGGEADSSPMNSSECRKYRRELLRVKSAVNTYCFPEDHPQYRLFVKLLDQLPDYPFQFQRRIVSIGVKTCGDVRNSAWSRAVLYYLAPIKLRKSVSYFLGDIPPDDGFNDRGTADSLRQLSIHRVDQLLRKGLQRNYGLDDDQINRLLYGRFCS